MAKTLTRQLLNDLHKGNSSIALLPVKNGEVDFSALDFTEADLIFSLKDSFQISQEDPEVTEIKIDQGDETIDTDTDAGSVNISANYPSNAEEAFAFFYEEATTTATVTAPDGKKYKGKGFFNTPKEVECSLLAQSQSKKTAIVFARVKLTVSMKQDDASNPLYLALTGKVLTNLKENAGDFVILKEGTAEMAAKTKL